MANEPDESQSHTPHEEPAAGASAPLTPPEGAVPRTNPAALTSEPTPPETPPIESKSSDSPSAEGTPTSTPPEPSSASPESTSDEYSTAVVPTNPEDPAAAHSSAPQDAYHTEYSHHDESPDPLYDDTEEGGGPIKSFLEHLEDFRWVLIRSATAILIGMTVCLLAANWIVAILKWPLQKSAQLYPDKRQYVSVMFGPKEVINFRLETNNLPAWPLATNKYTELELVPMTLGTNKVLVLGVRAVGDSIPAAKAKPIIYKGPAEPFINALHIAFFGGLLLSAPFVTYFIAHFIVPALKPRERKYFLKAMVPAALLFITGVCLCYFLILPLALRAAEQYSLWMGVEMPFWQAAEYFSFCIKFMLGMGLGFEMPVILLALVKIGVLDYDKLRRGRRYMILINLILGALLTTPEVLTQVAMFIPLQILYEVTIWIAWYWERQARRQAEPGTP